MRAEPEVSATLEYRRAESSCCKAGVAPVAGDSAPSWSCRACGKPCLKVTGAPQAVSARG